MTENKLSALRGKTFHNKW